MSLTSDQKKELKNLNKKLRELQKLAIENSIDLDVFMTEYREDGVSLYATEKVIQSEEAFNRKNVFEKHENPKKPSFKNH